VAGTAIVIEKMIDVYADERIRGRTQRPAGYDRKASFALWRGTALDEVISYIRCSRRASRFAPS